MLLPLITSSIVAVISGAWVASSIFLKYFLVGLIAKNFYSGTFTPENFEKDILDSSELVVTSLIIVGLVFAVFDFRPSPIIKVFSEFVALIYFGFLFWKY